MNSNQIWMMFRCFLFVFTGQAQKWTKIEIRLGCCFDVSLFKSIFFFDFCGWNQREMIQHIRIKAKNGWNHNCYADHLLKWCLWLESTGNDPKYKNKIRKMIEIIVFIQIEVFANDFCGWNNREMIQNIWIKTKSYRVRAGNIPPYCVGFIPTERWTREISRIDSKDRNKNKNWCKL